MSLALEHRVLLADPRAHLVEVETTVRDDEGLPLPLVLFMPAWTPGSYAIREHARHVEGLTCTFEGAGGGARKVRKNAWACAPIDPRVAPARAATVRYRLYCNELSVRTNHFDETHAFLTPAATFLAVEGRPDAPSTLEVRAPDGWRVVTSLAGAEGPDGRSTFAARDLEALLDAPLEIGTPRLLEFTAAGAPARLAITPAGAVTDDEAARLVTCARAVLEAAAGLLGGPPPWTAYTARLHLAGRTRGGLEHASGATLVAPREALATREGYLDVLALLAHEVLHAWNVKRIRPAALAPAHLERESYTRLLWWFEGATSYYDWRLVRRADLCTVPEYLAHLASEIAALDAAPGRLVASLEDASFDAWIKLYRPDENTPNSTVSYYRKGELACAMLDLEIRARTAGARSLDDGLRALERAHGATGIPLEEDGLDAVLARATGVDVAPLLDAWVRAPGELDYARGFGHVGLRVERHVRAEAPRAALGLRARDIGGRVVVAHAPRGGAAQRAGIDAGDELLAVAGRRVEGPSLDALVRPLGPGDEVEVLVARDGLVHARRVALDAAPADRVRLVHDPDATAGARALFRAWAHGPHPALREEAR